MNLSIVAAIGLGKGIVALKGLNPAGYALFKELIGIAGKTLTRLSEILADDNVSADEIDAVLDEVQGTGTGRLIISYVSGLIGAALKR